MKFRTLPVEWDRIHLIFKAGAITLTLREILSGTSVLAFDTEWRPEYKRGQFHPIELIQIATTRNVFLIKTHNFTADHWRMLQLIFENEDIMKIGFAIKEDIRKLSNRRRWKVRGHLDIQRILVNQGLRTATEQLLGFTLNKSSELTEYNWNSYLKPEHQLYAARDAVAPLYLALSIWERVHERMSTDDELACFLNLLAIRMRRQKVSSLDAHTVAPTLMRRLATPVKAQLDTYRGSEKPQTTPHNAFGKALYTALEEKGLDREGLLDRR